MLEGLGLSFALKLQNAKQELAGSGSVYKHAWEPSWGVGVGRHTRSEAELAVQRLNL